MSSELLIIMCVEDSIFVEVDNLTGIEVSILIECAVWLNIRQVDNLTRKWIIIFEAQMKLTVLMFDDSVVISIMLRYATAGRDSMVGRLQAIMMPHLKHVPIWLFAYKSVCDNDF